MSGDDTRLLTGTALTPVDLRHADFPAAVIGGYRVRDVEVFRETAASALEQMYRALDDRRATEEELVHEVQRLQEALQQAAGNGAPGPEAGRVLALAQQNADSLLTDARQEAAKIVGQAREAAGQLLARAEQQGAAAIKQAATEAEAERTRIIDEASAEGRRVASGFRALAAEMGTGLQEMLEALGKRAAEWDQRARESQAPPRAAARSGTGSRRATGAQRQASARA